MISVNLIPKARRERQEARRRRARWIRVLRLYAIALAVGCALTMLPAHAAAPSLESIFARLDRRIEAANRTLEDSRKHTDALGKQLDLARAVGEHPDWSLLLGAVARARADNAVLDSLELSFVKVEEKPAKADAAKPAPAGKPASHETVVVKLAGLCPSPAACFEFAHALETLDLFERVVVKETRAQSLGAMPATHFEIEAVVPGAPTPDARPAPEHPTVGEGK